MEPRELLEALVATVATLGELAATMARDGDVLLAMHPKSLHKALETFTLDLCKSLWCQCFVTDTEHRDFTLLSQALGTFGATLEAPWADVTAAFRAWRELMDVISKSWWKVEGDTTRLLCAWENVGNAEASAEATTTTLPGCPFDLNAVSGTPGYELGAMILHELKVALAPMMAPNGDPVPAPPEVVKEAMEAKSRTWAVASSEQQEVVLGLLRRFLAACDEASMFPWELERRLGDIEVALAETKEGSRGVPKALVVAVAEAERLWAASARLAMDHLLLALQDIHNLLSSPSGSSGGPGGLFSRRVAERCQKAKEDVPRLLGGQ